MPKPHANALTSTRHTAALAALAVALLAALAFVPGASADKVITEPGEGAGKASSPQGLAVDTETGRLYVADAANNRIDVFDASGSFEKAFGWGVKDGESKFQVCTTSCRKGIPGPGNGQLDRPYGIAVDNIPGSPARHDIYVSNVQNSTGLPEDFRIEKFDPEGNFILSIGGGVDKTAPGNVCTAASGHTCGAGANGFGEGQFSSNVYVGVGPGGVVYVIDSEFSGQESNSKARLQKFEPSGVPIAPQHIIFEGSRAAGLAIDSGGDFYTAGNFGAFGAFGAVRKYDSNGVQLKEFPTSVPDGGLAVDAADDLFVSESAGAADSERHILEYDASGLVLRSFAYGTFHASGGNVVGLAFHHSVSGEVYASEDSSVQNPARVLHVPFPAPGPIIFPHPCEANPLGNTKATLNAKVNPEGNATTFHFEYVDQEHFEAGGFSNPATKITAESESIGSDFVLRKVSAAAEVVPSTTYHCRVIAANSDAPAGVEGEAGAFKTLPPLEIGASWATAVGTEAATLNATVNSLGIPTTGYFEYVSDATYQHDIAELGPTHGFDHATNAPDTGAGEEPIDFGSGESQKAGAAVLSGLVPGTTYRYRIVATDPYFPAGFPGPTKSFRTYGPGGGGLLDDRAYELVSPAQKEGAEVAIPGPSAGLSFAEHVERIQAAAGSGEAITYTSWSSFGDPKGAPAASQYLSRRTATGWGTENVSPFGILRNAIEPPFRGFSPDLGIGAFATSEPALTPEAQEGFENLYLRDSETGSLQALTTEAPQFTPDKTAQAFQNFCTGYAGASADGHHVIFAADGAMAGAPAGTGISLYEWSAAEGLALVSVLPDENPAQPAKQSGFGPGGAVCSMDQKVVRHAISEDGSTIFWTYGGKYKNSERPLLARIDGAETIQLDAKVAGEKSGGGGVFWAATGDGSEAFFTAPGKLTADAKAEGQLYLYDIEARAPTDLTPGPIPPEIKGVIGVSDDGDYAYFVARSALTGEEENAAHEKALKGANNLYVWHQGEGLRFIAALSNSDEGDWSSAPSTATARLTPDGRHLAFLSIEAEALSDYENAISPGTHCQPFNVENQLIGDPHCAQAYLYDAESATLTCASCNPSSARPTGPTGLPSWSNPYEGPHYLSDDGSRLYFESRDALSGADENGKRDVYEFEQAGAGTCDSESPSFDSTSGGCLSLISSGRSKDQSYLLDASADGRDVFFSTRQTLVGWDTSENFDVYDARAGGGFPEPSEEAHCVGEACKPPVLSPPSSSSPGTPSFRGPGNTVEKTKKHKSKKKSKHKSKKKHTRASHKQKAGR
jgi:DNA-binding beta-propeller fold protein YncE